MQIILDHKGIEYERIDGLTPENRELLSKINRRLEVPAIDHDGLIVWYRRCRGTPILANDPARTRAFMSNPTSFGGVERNKISWRGDRIEWILARRYRDWFMKEIQDGRVLWPEVGVPA